MKLFVAHHHGFKCAGSTVVHLLNRNWPGRVLHIENRQVDKRLHCEQVQPFIEKGSNIALTSHLLTMPPPGQELAHVHFALVRDPIERLVSAFHFVPEERKLGGFLQFVAAHEHHACNFHVRHLARQGATANPRDWPADPTAVPLGDPSMLIGLVERFEDTMFLLEQRLAALGCRFDGSVGQRQNVGKSSGLDLPPETVGELRERNGLDYELCARIGTALDRELATVDPTGRGRAEHRARCDKRAGKNDPYKGQPPRDWVYLED